MKHLYITQIWMKLFKDAQINKAVWSYPKLNEAVQLGPNLNGVTAICSKII